MTSPRGRLKPYLATVSVITFAASLSACKARRDQAQVRSDDAVTMARTSQVQNLELGMGVNIFTGGTSNSRCLVVPPEGPDGQPLPPVAAAQLTDGPDGSNTSVATIDAPDLGLQTFNNELIAGADIDANSGANKSLVMALGGQDDDGSLDVSANKTGMALADDSLAEGFKFYSILYDNAFTAHSTLKASVGGTYAAFRWGELKLTASMENLFNTNDSSQYLIIEGNYNRRAKVLLDPTFAPIYSPLVEKITAGEADSPEALEAFQDECYNMYVSGIIQGARIRIVASILSNSQDGSTSVKATADLANGVISADASSVKDFLRSLKVTKIVVETIGGVPVVASNLEGALKALDEWMAAVKPAATALQQTGNFLAPHYAILEPYNRVKRYVPADAKAPKFILSKKSLFENPLAPPRDILRRYYAFYMTASEQIERLESAVSKGDKSYAAALETTKTYQATLLENAQACIKKKEACNPPITPPLNPNLPTPGPSQPPPQPLAPKPLVSAMNVSQNLLTRETMKVTYMQAQNYCASIKGGYHLPTSDQLRYLMDHNEIQHKGYTLKQWVLGDGMWTSDIHKKNGFDYHTIFSMEVALRSPKLSPNFDVKRSTNYSPNMFYVACVIDP